MQLLDLTDSDNIVNIFIVSLNFCNFDVRSYGTRCKYFNLFFLEILCVHTKRGTEVTETTSKKKEVAKILQLFLFLHASGEQIIKHHVLPGKWSKPTNFEVTWYLVVFNSEPFSNFPFLPEDYIPHVQQFDGICKFMFLRQFIYMFYR